MRSNLMGEAFYIAWKSYGIEFDKIVETDDDITFYISTPSSSYHIDAKGNQMANMYLAKRFQETLTEMGFKNVIVKAKARNQYWTKDMSDFAMNSARKELYRSQA